jgi:hypothetical protein
MIVQLLLLGFLAKTLLDILHYYTEDFKQGEYKDKEFYRIDGIPKWQAVAAEAGTEIFTALLSELLAAWAGSKLTESLFAKELKKLRDKLKGLNKEEKILQRRLERMMENAERGLCHIEDIDEYIDALEYERDGGRYADELKRLWAKKEMLAVGLFLFQAFEWGIEYLMWAGELMPALKHSFKTKLIDFLRFVNNIPRDVDLTDPDMRRLFEEDPDLAEMLQRRNNKTAEVIDKLRKAILFRKGKKKWEKERRGRMAEVLRRDVKDGEYIQKRDFSIYYYYYEYAISGKYFSTSEDLCKSKDWAFDLPYGAMKHGKYGAGNTGYKSEGTGIAKVKAKIGDMMREVKLKIDYKERKWFKDIKLISDYIPFPEMLPFDLTYSRERIETVKGENTISREDAYFYIRALQNEPLITREDVLKHKQKLINRIQKRYEQAIKRRKEMANANIQAINEQILLLQKRKEELFQAYDQLNNQKEKRILERLLKRIWELQKKLSEEAKKEREEAEKKIKELEDTMKRLIDEVNAEIIPYDQVFSGLFVLRYYGFLMEPGGFVLRLTSGYGRRRITERIYRKAKEHLYGITIIPFHHPGEARCCYFCRGGTGGGNVLCIFNHCMRQDFMTRYKIFGQYRTDELKGVALYEIDEIKPEMFENDVSNIPKDYVVAVVYKRLYRRRKKRLNSMLMREESYIVKTDKRCKRLKKKYIRDKVRVSVLKDGIYLFQENESLHEISKGFLKKNKKQILVKIEQDRMYAMLYKSSERVIYVYEVIFTEKALRALKSVKEIIDYEDREKIENVFNNANGIKKKISATKRRKLVCT